MCIQCITLKVLHHDGMLIPIWSKTKSACTIEITVRHWYVELFMHINSWLFTCFFGIMLVLLCLGGAAGSGAPGGKLM